MGERNYELAHQVWRDALSVDWRGETADAVRTATHADMQTTSATVDQLQAAASAARSGASDLDAARARVQYVVQDARAAGFEVGEDLSVSDRMTAGSVAQQAARQSAAQALAADIGQRAAQLVSLDTQVAGNVTAAMASVANAFPRNPGPVSPPTDSGVRAVDSHTYKQDPPQPIPVDPKDMTADEARAAWAEVNAEVKAWNTRCGVENVGPLPPAQYSACVASRGPLLQRQAAIRARLGQLGIPVEGEGPTSPGTEEPPFPPPRQIEGFTSHGRESADDHDGHGVNDSALQDAVEHPVEPPRYEVDEQGRGAYIYTGKDAAVVLNKDGQVVTTWPRNRQGWRHE